MTERGRIRERVVAWGERPQARLVAPVVCVVFEAAFLTRYISFLSGDYDPASVWLLLWCVAAVLACVFLRGRYPLGALLAACACAAACAHVDEGNYTSVPLLVLLYGVVARADWPRAVAAVIAVIAAFWAPVHLAGEGALALVHLEWTLAVVAAALVSRTLWTRRQAARELEGERLARERAARERDEAEARSRIAAELHDSVGHDLTAIIALSEGLAGATGDAVIDDAIARINDLARAGLADTRRAVRSIGRLGAVPVEGPERHGWDDLAPALADARATGLAAALTETGARPHDDPAQADLALRVSREAVTNALRHARGATRLTVSWDHGADGGCVVTARDNGRPGEKDGASAASDGTGLARLRAEVEAAGGSFSAGPGEGGGWCVRAALPRMAREGDA